MQKAFVPQTVVPGARRAYHDLEDGEMIPRPKNDLKGRPVWDMPKPSGFHKITIVNKDGRFPATAPVYKGYPAEIMRHAKAQFKRMQRKAAEKAALEAAEQEAASGEGES